jgi:hypothetical protein
MGSQVLHKKLVVVQALDKFPPFMQKNVHYSVYSSPPLVPFLGQFNAVHTLISYSTSTLIQPSHLHRHLLRRLFTSTFPTKVSCAIFFSSVVLYVRIIYRVYNLKRNPIYNSICKLTDINATKRMSC